MQSFGESGHVVKPTVAPSGPFWAGILATGIGCASLGILVDLAETSKAVSKALNFYGPTGDLSGKTVLTVIIWGFAWGILHTRWKHREIQSPRRIMIAALVLVFMGFLAVFPPFFELFATS